MLNIRNLILNKRYGEIKGILLNECQWRQMVKKDDIGKRIINTVYNPKTRKVEKIVEQYPDTTYKQVFWKNGNGEITDEFIRYPDRVLQHRIYNNPNIKYTETSIGYGHNNNSDFEVKIIRNMFDRKDVLNRTTEITLSNITSKAIGKFLRPFSQGGLN